MHLIGQHSAEDGSIKSEWYCPDCQFAELRDFDSRFVNKPNTTWR
jgi:hypothetical protein